MTSQSGKQTISTQILPNISRSGGNHAMKFGQLVKYNKRDLSLENSHTKCGGGTIPRSCSEKSKLSISPDQKSKVLYSLFLLYANSRVIKRY